MPGGVTRGEFITGFCPQNIYSVIAQLSAIDLGQVGLEQTVMDSLGQLFGHFLWQTTDLESTLMLVSGEPFCMPIRIANLDPTRMALGYRITSLYIKPVP